jgi:hypothetical protein
MHSWRRLLGLVLATAILVPGCGGSSTPAAPEGDSRPKVLKENDDIMQKALQDARTKKSRR